MEENKTIYTTTDSKMEAIWIYGFRLIGTIMFLAGVWEAVITMFWLDKEVVPMSKYQITFAAVGFVLAFAGKSFGTIANNIGMILSDKLKNLLT